MAVVLLAAFLMIACLLALRFEKQLTAVLPLATCILILILYVLAFFQRLSWTIISAQRLWWEQF